jgi:hypothetical protein
MKKDSNKLQEISCVFITNFMKTNLFANEFESIDHELKLPLESKKNFYFFEFTKIVKININHIN